jgi:hypothetical protein
VTAIARTILTSLGACIVLLVGYFLYSQHQEERRIAELEALRQEMETRLAEREAMIRRLSRSQRVAHIEVVDQALAPSTGEGTLNRAVESTTIRFIELDDEGAELARQEMTVPGAVLFIDAWTVKFGQEDVALGHPLRGRTLVLLRRVYSDRMQPKDGIPIDTPGAVPAGYAASDMGRFEMGIWEQFWQIAGDAELAERMGVRVAQGEAVYKPVRAGQQFELVVDAAGGINLTPLRAQAAVEN